MGAAAAEHRTETAGTVGNVARTGSFWVQIARVYAAYKLSQVRACTLRALRMSQGDIDRMWEIHHTWAGEQLYALCTDLRGFYIKVGQFLGARSDFIPEPICRKLVLLQDRVPPMGAQQARSIIESELGQATLDSTFSWIDLERPLGSATIAQVHKAALRRPGRDPEVAVKVQYPRALETMLQDLGNIRIAAQYLQDTELNFDLVSPVDELAKQICLEFDFVHEAEVMDSIADSLQSMAGEVSIPRSIPGLVSQNLLVMTFLSGTPITRMQEEAEKLPQWKQELGKRLLLERVAEAYGRMILEAGMFQADCHPGNILVSNDGHIGLVDFGQCKQLPRQAQLAFAELLINLAAAGSAPLPQVLAALDQRQQAGISASLAKLGIRTGEGPLGTRVRLAYGMFDTRGRVDPFTKDSPLKAMAIERFPSDLFFLLRVIQLLRGLSNAMGIDFSVAAQWKPLAQVLLQEQGLLPVEALEEQAALAWPGGFVLGGLAPGQVLWWNALRKPLGMGLRLGPRLATAWAVAHGLAAMGLALSCRSGGVVHQARMLGLGTLQLLLQLAWSWYLFRTRRLGQAAALGWLASVAALLATASFAEVSSRAAALTAPAALGVAAAAALGTALWRRNGGLAGSNSRPTPPLQRPGMQPATAGMAGRGLPWAAPARAQMTRLHVGTGSAVPHRMKRSSWGSSPLASWRGCSRLACARGRHGWVADLPAGSKPVRCKMRPAHMVHALQKQTQAATLSGHWWRL